MVRARHWIAEDLLTGRKREDHVVEQIAVNRRWDDLLRNERPPGDVSGIERREIGKELLADARAQAVGADQHLPGRGGTPGEMRGHAAGALLDMLERHAATVAFSRKGIAEHAKKPVPRGQRLRAFGLPDHLAGAIEHPPPAHFDAEFDVGIEPHGAEYCAQLRLRHDPGAAAGKLALDPLEHFDVPAAARQCQRGEQPAHRAADHERTPQALHLCIRAFLPRPPRVIHWQAPIASAGATPMALTMMDKQAVRAEKTAWPQWLTQEFEQERRHPNGCVGTELLSESDRGRGWAIRPKPGARGGIPRHELDYFWSAVTPGRWP